MVYVYVNLLCLNVRFDVQSPLYMERERERERYLYSSVVTGTCYGTKTPPVQQPTNPCAGAMTRRELSTWVSKYGHWGVQPGLVWGGVHSLVVCACCGGISFGWDRSEVGMVGLWVLWLLFQLFICFTEGGYCGIAQAFCFWKALLSLTNLASVMVIQLSLILRTLPCPQPVIYCCPTIPFRSLLCPTPKSVTLGLTPPHS